MADELPVHYRGGVGKSEMIRGLDIFSLSLFHNTPTCSFLILFISDCIVNDICDRAADIFFTWSANKCTKGLVKSLDFPTQLKAFFHGVGKKRLVHIFY